MAIYQDGTMPYGTLMPGGPEPRLVDAPNGSRVKLRFHQRDITKAFIRHANGTFSVWSLDWVDQKERTLKLAYPIAQTVRHPALK